MGARRLGRELALQALYSIDLNPGEVGSAVAQLWEESKGPELSRVFAEELVKGVIDNRPEIDRRIAEKSRNWPLTRMAKVDLNILRLAAFELLFRTDIPRNVTINEAIEVAKTFGTEESPAFVNGILDEIAQTLPEK